MNSEFWRKDTPKLLSTKGNSCFISEKKENKEV
jgi:hypothetical protein